MSVADRLNFSAGVESDKQRTASKPLAYIVPFFSDTPHRNVPLIHSTYILLEAMATIIIDEQNTPKKQTLAAAELDSFLFEADAAVNTNGLACTSSVATNGSAMLSPSQRDTVKFSELIRGPPALQRRLKVPADDDVSISSNTVLSRDVTVYSKGNLIANIEDVDDIMHRLTRPSPAAAHEHLNPADIALMEVAREALAKDACAASAKSCKSSTMSRASGASKPPTRSSRIVNVRRGSSLERDISKYILQTAAGGADEAHFLVLADGSTELASCPQAILQDLLMTQLPERNPGEASSRSTRSIDFRSKSKIQGKICDDTVSDVHVGIKSVESKDTMHAVTGTSRMGLNDDSAPPEDELNFVDGHVLIAVVAVDNHGDTGCPTSIVPSDSPPECVVDEMPKSVKQEYVAPACHETVESPIKCTAESASWNCFGPDIVSEFEYHDAADCNGSTLISSSVMPSINEEFQASGNETGSVVMDLLAEESVDEDKPSSSEDQVDAVLDNADRSAIQYEPEGRYMASILETTTEEEEAFDDGSDAASRVSEARSVILSFAEHAAHAYNLQPVESIDDCPLESTTSEETPAHDESQQKDAVESAATICENAIAIHNVFESSENGFGGIYAFDMNEEEDWITFEASIAESSNNSPSRQTFGSSADNDASNTVYSAPLDGMKRDVAEPDSPTSVVSKGSRLAAIL
jgi:hypothetical protein